MTHVDSSTSRRTRGRGYAPWQVRRSLWLVLLAWVFGAAFFSITSGAAFISLLTNFLKTSDASFGLVLAAGSAAILFQFVGSYMVERTGRVKRNFIIFATLHRLLWLLVAAVPLLPQSIPNGTRVGMIGLIGFASTAFAAYGSAGWHVWMSGLIPKSLAGKYFGIRSALGLISMVVSALGVGILLKYFEGQAWVYTLMFGVAAILGATDILLFLPIPEQPRDPGDNPPTLLDVFVTPWKDEVFRGFALYTVVAWIAYLMMGPFVWRFMFDPVSNHGLGMSPFLAQLLLVIIPWLVMAWSSPFWGRAVDRFGTKPVLAAASLCSFVIPSGYLFLHHGTEWILWVMVVLAGLTWPGIDQAIIYMQIKGFPDERRATYNATFGMVIGVASMVGPALGGLLATFWQLHITDFTFLPDWVSHYHPLFLTSIVLRMAAFVFLMPRLRLPGSAHLVTVGHAVAKDAVKSIPGVSTVAKARKDAASEQDDETVESKE
ncbi:MAG: MFS transporter [Armatimonadota bacterium]